MNQTLAPKARLTYDRQLIGLQGNTVFETNKELMGETARGLIPRPSREVDISQVKLTAEEGFVWSRVDGLLSLDELCVVTGLGKERTRQIIEHLQGLGLITIDEDPSNRKPPVDGQVRTSSREATGPIPGPTSAARTTGDATGPIHLETERAAETSSPENRDQGADSNGRDVFSPLPDVDLSEDLQRTIWEFHESLDRLDFYAVLGVTPEADGKKIDRAYKLRSLKFHPDRYYGKKLGPYQNKLEEIFKFLTEVRNFLLDSEKRRAYDENLAADRALKQQISEEMAREQEVLDKVARDAASKVTAGHGTGRDQAARQAERHVERVRPGKGYRRRPSRLRLKALASVLGMDPSEPGQQETSQSPMSPPSRPRTAGKHTSRLFRLAGNNAERKAKAKSFYDEGIKKLLDNNFVGAATSLKLALSFDPDNEEYKSKYEVASNRAKELMAERFYKQARFQESVGRWKSAASLYVRAADHYPIAEYLSRAANALLMTDDISLAQEYANRGVELEPDNAEAKITLAKVYIEAGLPKNAKRELEAAIHLDSENELAKAMLREIRKRK